VEIFNIIKRGSLNICDGYLNCENRKCDSSKDDCIQCTKIAMVVYSMIDTTHKNKKIKNGE
jgi:hypothetical protein